MMLRTQTAVRADRVHPAVAGQGWSRATRKMVMYHLGGMKTPVIAPGSASPAPGEGGGTALIDTWRIVWVGMISNRLRTFPPSIALRRVGSNAELGDRFVGRTCSTKDLKRRRVEEIQLSAAQDRGTRPDTSAGDRRPAEVSRLVKESPYGKSLIWGCARICCSWCGPGPSTAKVARETDGSDRLRARQGTSGGPVAGEFRRRATRSPHHVAGYRKKSTRSRPRNL